MLRRHGESILRRDTYGFFIATVLGRTTSDAALTVGDLDVTELQLTPAPVILGRVEMDAGVSIPVFAVPGCGGNRSQGWVFHR